MYFSHIFLKVSFNYVLLSRLLYSAKGISATDILPVMCLGSDVALNKSKFIIIILKKCIEWSNALEINNYLAWASPKYYEMVVK